MQVIKFGEGPALAGTKTSGTSSATARPENQFRVGVGIMDLRRGKNPSANGNQPGCCTGEKNQRAPLQHENNLKETV